MSVGIEAEAKVRSERQRALSNSHGLAEQASLIRNCDQSIRNAE